MAARPIALRCGELALSVDIAGGGRAVSLCYEGEELLGGRSNDPVEFGMYAMGPWAGRLQRNELRVGEAIWQMPATYGEWALHGTVLDREWQVVGFVQESDHAWLAASAELGESWPWRGSIELSWSLHRSVLRTDLIVRAHDSEFPAVVGMHPWFCKHTRFGEAHWEVKDSAMAERRADFSLTGQFAESAALPGTADDAFLVPGRRARVVWGEELTLDIHQSHQWFVIYDELDDFLCLEPQTGPPDGVNEGSFGPITWVSPGTPLSQQTAWSFRRG